ncbi:MAG: glycine betaine/L-proline ABC transporter ATP-binding protein [Desulfobacterales bacterium]
MEKIIVEDVYKVFGPDPSQGIEMYKQGLSKDEIQDKTKNVIGVADVSFAVNEGEILVIMGLSGSGKSTLVRCLNRLIEPTTGKITVDGIDITGLDNEQLRKFRLEHLSMVFQNFALFPHRTVLDNVGYGLEIQNAPPEKRRERSMNAITQVGLKGNENSYPDQLSGGMQQRVGLARALAMDSDIMLMDEAFSALDPLIRSDMQDELLQLQEKVQKTIVFISHDLDEALKIGDRIVLMKDGYIVQSGTAEEILTNPADDYVAKFVEDVDMAKVITAESVMLKPAEMAYYSTDGPKAALRKMKHAGISGIFVRKDKKLIGYVSADDALESAKRGDPTLENVLQKDIETITIDTPAVDIIPLLARLPYPVPVVDEQGRLRGVVIKGSLLAGLAERGTE